MTVRDLIPMAVDIDVYDDVCEELEIAYCGPYKLTDEGEKVFADALALPIEMNDDYVVVHVDDADEKTWKRRLRAAKRFFYAIAGYCDANDFDKWFVEVEA